MQNTLQFRDVRVNNLKKKTPHGRCPLPHLCLLVTLHIGYVIRNLLAACQINDVRGIHLMKSLHVIHHISSNVISKYLDLHPSTNEKCFTWHGEKTQSAARNSCDILTLETH